MARELPIACSLSAAELPARLAAIGAVGREGLVDARVNDAQALLRFRADVRPRLAAIVAAEAQCCAFLAMSLGDADGHDEVELRIEAPPGGEATMHELVAAFKLER
jgi:hypothetical protein